MKSRKGMGSLLSNCTSSQMKVTRMKPSREACDSFRIPNLPTSRALMNEASDMKAATAANATGHGPNP